MEPISDYSEGLLTTWFSIVSKHLTGRAVSIKWSNQIMRGRDAWGLANKTAGGGAEIVIRRGLGWEESFHTFLHECGHIKLTYKALWYPNDPRFNMPDSIRPKPMTTKEHRKRANEIKAIDQAAIWQKWARSRASTSLIVPQLEALMEYSDG
jgi:hypothetical protein